VTNPAGDTTIFRKVDSRGELDREVEALRKQFGAGYKIITHDIQGHGDMATMSEPELRALGKLAGTDPDLVDKFLGDGVADFLKARSSFGGHLVRRSGVAGFSEDLKRVGTNYGVSAAKRIANMKLRRTVEPELKSLAESDQKLHSYWKQHLQYVTTPQHDYNLVREAVFHVFLGGPNVMSAGFNLTQTPMVTMPVYSSLGGARGIGELMKAQRVLLHMVARTVSGPLTLGQKALDLTKMAKAAYPDIAADIQWAHDSQVIEGRERSDFQDTAAGLTGADKVKVAALVNQARAASGFLFGTTEKTNRIIAFVSGLKMAQSKMDDNGFWRRLGYLGYDGPRDARRAAAFLVDKTQYVYGKENRAGFQKGVAGLVFALKSYLANTVHLQYQLAKGGMRGGSAGDRVRFASGAALMTAVVGSMAGMFGAIPLVGDVVKELVDKLVGWIRRDKWNMDDDLEKTLPKPLADMMTQGAGKALTNAGVLPDWLPDLGKRASVGNFIPTKLDAWATSARRPRPLRAPVRRCSESATAWAPRRPITSPESFRPRATSSPRRGRTTPWT
jgi:hypothetical protein